MKTKTMKDYYSFLLRMWLVKGNGGPKRRASLQNVDNGEKRGFTSLESLLDYLIHLTKAWEETSSEKLDQGCRAEVSALHLLEVVREDERREDWQKTGPTNSDAQIFMQTGSEVPRIENGETGTALNE